VLDSAAAQRAEKEPHPYRGKQTSADVLQHWRAPDAAERTGQDRSRGERQNDRGADMREGERPGDSQGAQYCKARADQIGGEDGLAVPGRQGMHRPEGDPERQDG